MKSRKWIVDENDNIIIGEGRKEILENIEKTGSINQTAKLMKMSYKAVWSKIKATENYLKVKIVSTNKKRGSHLTPAGKELLHKYTLLKNECQKQEEDLFKAIFHEGEFPLD
jgi:molybdate transport system regulatory protein